MLGSTEARAAVEMGEGNVVAVERAVGVAVGGRRVATWAGSTEGFGSGCMAGTFVNGSFEESG
jgi:hypothetical protein